MASGQDTEPAPPRQATATTPRLGALGAHRERLAAAGVIALAAAVVLASFAPGRMDFDTLFQLNETANGDFTNQHAPVIHAIWKPFYDLGIGPGWVVLAQTLTFLVGGYFVLRVALRPMASALAVAAISLYPPVFLMLGTVMRDTWFTALLVLTAGLAIRAAQAEPRHRLAWIVAFAVATWLTLATRQNAAPAVAAICIVLAFVLLPSARAMWRRVAGAVVVAGLAIVAMLASVAVAVDAVGARDVNPEQYLYLYDVAAASVREDENLFPAEVMAQRDVGVVERTWTVDNVLPLVFGTEPVISAPLPPDAFDSLRDAWLDQLGDDPIGYLGSRTELFAHQLSIGAAPVLVVAQEANYGFDHWFGAVRELADDYVSLFTREEGDPAFPELIGGPLFTVWVYLLVALGACFVLLRRGMPAPMLLAGSLALSAVTLQLGLYLGAMGIGYRLELPLVAAALLTAPVAVVAVLRRRS